MRLEVRQNERGREFASLTTTTRWNRGKRDEDRGKKTKIFSLFRPLTSYL